MSEDYEVIYLEKPDWSVIGPLIGGGLNAYNIEKAGEDHSQSVCFILQGPGEEIIGGLIGETHWDWFYVNVLWLKEEFRGLGYGHRILTLAEEEARRRGAKNAYLDTFSFQAPDFYKEHGYELFGELPDFPTGHKRCYFKKAL